MVGVLLEQKECALTISARVIKIRRRKQRALKKSREYCENCSVFFLSVCLPRKHFFFIIDYLLTTYPHRAHEDSFNLIGLTTLENLSLCKFSVGSPDTLKSRNLSFCRVAKDLKCAAFVSERMQSILPINFPFIDEINHLFTLSAQTICCQNIKDVAIVIGRTLSCCVRK